MTDHFFVITNGPFDKREEFSITAKDNMTQFHVDLSDALIFPSEHSNTRSVVTIPLAVAQRIAAEVLRKQKIEQLEQCDFRSLLGLDPMGILKQ